MVQVQSTAHQGHPESPQGHTENPQGHIRNLQGHIGNSQSHIRRGFCRRILAIDQITQDEILQNLITVQDHTKVRVQEVQGHKGKVQGHIVKEIFCHLLHTVQGQLMEHQGHKRSLHLNTVQGHQG